MASSTGGTHHKRGKSHRNGNGAGEPVVALPPGRVPPYNLDAEKSLLGGVLLDREAPLKDLAEVCGAADFYREAHRKAWEAMLSLLEDDAPIDRVSVLERLQERGDLDAAGGAAYLEELDNHVPTAANLVYYAKIVHDKARARKLIETFSSLVQLGYDQHGDVGDFIGEAQRRMREVVDAEQPKTTDIGKAAVSLSRESLRAAPPRREYMLVDAKGRGIFIQGKIGLLAAPGGTGKSWALSGAAVSVATGRPWFGSDGWAPAKPGRVLFVLAEEDGDEVHRLLHHTARAMGATADEDLDLVAQNIDAFGLAGHSVALTIKDEGRAAVLPETSVAVKLREAIKAAAVEGRPYVLIILDPLSRFAGVDTEKDAAAATRFVQVIETFTAAEYGKPSVILSCHTRKGGEDENRQSADWIRGTTALKDAVRWAAIIEQQKRRESAADLLTLRIVKAAGVAPQFSPLYLCRDRSHEGFLRVATPVEIASHEDGEDAEKKFKTLGDYEARVLELVKPGQAYQKTELVETAGGKRSMLYAAIAKLVREEELKEVGRGKTTRVMLNTQADLSLQVPQVPASVPAAGKGTGQSSSPPVSPPVVPGGNRGNLAVPGSARNADLPSASQLGSRSSQSTGTDEPPPHTDEDLR